MIRLKRILPLFLLTVFVLSACSQKPSETVVSDKGDTEPVVEVEVVEEAIPESGIEPAIYSSDYSCSDLKDNNRREACEVGVANLMGSLLESEILETYDFARCKELPEGQAENCETHLTATGVQGPVSVEEIEIFYQALQGAMPEDVAEEAEDDEINLVYDKTKCAELKTPGYKEYCETMIVEQEESSLLNQVLQSGDVSRCGELSTESLRNDCKESFAV